MDRIDLYFEIASHIYSVLLTLIVSFYYMVWVRPFLLKRRTAWLCGATYAVVMEILIIIPVNMTEMVAYGLVVMSVFLVMCLFDRGNAGQKFFLAVTFFCLRWQSFLIQASVGNELFLLQYKIEESLLGSVNGKNIVWLGSYFVQSVLDILLVIGVLGGSVRLMLWAYGAQREDMKGRELLILLVPSVSGLCTYEVLKHYEKIYERDSGKYVLDIYGYHDWLMLLYSVICFMTIFVMTYVFRQWQNEREEDKQREVFSRQVQDLESHIGEVERLYRDMRSLRHDMGNHLMTLEQLYGTGEYEQAEKYVGTLKREMQNISLDVTSGNPVTDIILSGRKKEMEDKGIQFVCDFHYPQTGGIDAFDVSIILNNALSNAIEAIERERMTGTDKGMAQRNIMQDDSRQNDTRVILKEETRQADENDRNMPHILLLSHCVKNMYIIEVSNPYQGELYVDTASGLPDSAKIGDGHGFGLANIRHVARKYYGDMEIGKEVREGESYCVLRVMLQLTG